MPALGELVRLPFAGGADGAAHRPAAGPVDLHRPEPGAGLAGPGDALASGLAGVVAGG
jgi:hypothetical protein